MLTPEEARQALSKLFQRRPVAELETLCEVLKTTSRMSVFRRLSLLGYLTSYSHAGRYYTLSNVPDFDMEGLWRFQGICFSRHGSLKATVVHLVDVADAGLTHSELSTRLQVRVHNAVLDLVRQGRIGREEVASLYLYVSADHVKAARQVDRRQLLDGADQTVQAPKITSPVLVEILLEIIHGASRVAAPGAVCDRLLARSVTVTLAQVQGVYRDYGLKKTAESRLKRSRR